MCKRRSSKSDPPCNLALKNLCEALSQELTLRDTPVQSEALCPQHSEKLKLFCLDHQQPVCLVCRDSRAHHNHSFRPIDEAGQEYKELLREHITHQQNRLEVFSKAHTHFIQTAEYIKQQGQHTEMMIQKEFKKMRVFLQKEEQARISVLRTEVQIKSSLMEQRVAALSQKISKHSEIIGETEKELKSQDVPFLQNYAAVVRRLKQVPLKDLPEFPSRSQVDVAKHLGNLGFNIWNKMKELVSYTPVVLDPNTASSFLVISDDLSSVHHVESGAVSAWVPDNPERFNYHATVLGSEGFNSGVQSWEVDVQNDANWAIGVNLETVPRKENIVRGYWEIWFRNGKYIAYAPSLVEKVLTLKQPPQRIRVELDWDRGKVSFTDSQTGSHIYTFTHTFDAKVFPFINTVNPNNIKISPVDFTVDMLQKAK